MQRFQLLYTALFLAILFPFLTCAQVPPPNDSFSNAIPIPGDSITVTGSNAGATLEAGDPLSSFSNVTYNSVVYSYNAGGRSVWWAWQATSNSPVTVDTFGTGFDTFVSVYRGDSLSNLIKVASNDDWLGSLSRITFNASAGTNYFIAVDSPGIWSGDIVLNLTTLALAPVITNRPPDQFKLTGSSFTLLPNVVGTAPLKFQWQKDGGDLPDATNASYAFLNAQPEASGLYRVIVSNAVDMAISSNIQVSIGNVVITNPPRDLVIASGYPATFSVAAIGSGSLQYQWQKNSNNIIGATNTTFTLTTVTVADQAGYRVIVTSTNGNATSPEAALTVIAPYTFSTFAGLAKSPGTNDGPGTQARFGAPHGITLDSSGSVFVSDIGNYDIRKITPEGVVSRVAGGSVGTNDGVGTAAQFGSPWGIAVASNGTLFVADAGTGSGLREITSSGVVSTVKKFTDFSSACVPGDVAIDATGNVLVALWTHNLLWKLGPDGIASYVAVKPAVKSPIGLGFDSAGDLYVAEEGAFSSGGQSVRKISRTGTQVLAGRTGFTGSVDGKGDAARFYAPHSAAVDAAGNAFVVDMNNHTLRRVSPSGIVTTLAGRAGASGSADGCGTNARFSSPRDVAVDAAGNLYLTDLGNGTIRKGVPFAVPTIPQSQAVLPGTPVNLGVGAEGSGPYYYQWLSNGVPLLGETNLTLALGPIVRSNSGLYSVMVSNTVGNSIQFNAVVRALYPPVLELPEVLADSQVQLHFQDADGGLPYDVSKVTVQWCTNLADTSPTNWLKLNSPFTVTNGFIWVNDTNTASLPARFYRVLEQ